MYQRILAAIDGSPGADRAADHAIDLATRYGAALHVVHALDVTDASGVSENAVEEKLQDSTREAVTRVTERAADAGVEVVEEYLHGPPTEAIVGYVDRHDVDLVVVGTHGRAGLSRVLLGSTAEEIVRESPAPVLIVRTEE